MTAAPPGWGVTVSASMSRSKSRYQICWLLALVSNGRSASLNGRTDAAKLDMPEGRPVRSTTTQWSMNAPGGNVVVFGTR